MRDLHRELDTWDGYPPAWRPKPGDILVGFIDSFDIGHTSYGPVRTVIVTVEATNEKVSLWLSSTVLLDQFKRQQPQPREKIGLKYLGKDPDKGYHRYRLLVDRTEPLTFEPLGGEGRNDEKSCYQHDHCAAQFGQHGSSPTALSDGRSR
jgi:hypothetical protein